MGHRCFLLLVGDELTTGAVSDTNGAYLAERMTLSGFTVVELLIVRDRLDEIEEGLKRATENADVVLMTGGLGPTSDDITRDAAANFLGIKLVEHAPSLEKIFNRYKARGIPFNPISQRQALFPDGVTIINNSEGTADGFLFELQNLRSTICYSFPGVPSELEVMFEEECLPALKKRFTDLKERQTSFLRCFGLSESAIGSAIESLKLGSEIIVGYRPVFPEVFVKFSSEVLEAARLEEAGLKAAEAIGLAHVISNDEKINLPYLVQNLLIGKKYTVSFAESCTGGEVSSGLIAAPGASAVLLGGVVSYSNELKEEFTGVSIETIKNFGAVSEQTAIELARGIRLRTKSSIGISTTGIAGPDGGTSTKPVGTVYLGFSREGREEVVHHVIPFERNRFRKYAAHAALDLIRRDMLGFPLSFIRR